MCSDTELNTIFVFRNLDLAEPYSVELNLEFCFSSRCRFACQVWIIWSLSESSFFVSNLILQHLHNQLSIISLSIYLSSFTLSFKWRNNSFIIFSSADTLATSQSHTLPRRPSVIPLFTTCIRGLSYTCAHGSSQANYACVPFYWDRIMFIIYMHKYFCFW